MNGLFDFIWDLSYGPSFPSLGGSVGRVTANEIEGFEFLPHLVHLVFP